MSEIARWSYKNTALVRPFLGIDTWSNQETFGPEYEIKCNFVANDSQERSSQTAERAELVQSHEIYTEDPRPKMLDMVLLNGHDNWERIKGKTEYEMELFDDTPDFKLTTG